MKYFKLLALALLFVSCSQDLADTTENDTTVADLFVQLSSTNNSTETYKGIFDGIIGTFDQSIHGHIVVSIYNDGSLTAGAKLLNGEELRFEGIEIDKNTYRFTGSAGHFEMVISDEREIKAYNVTLNGQDGFVSVFKNERGVATVLAFGTYVDSSDPSFTGVFDMINISGATDPAVPPFGPAFRIEDVFISHISGQTAMDGDAFNYETFTQCVFATLPITMSWSSGVNEVVDAHNQTSSFFGYECNWSVFYGIASGVVTYREAGAMCPEVSSGTWSWNGRLGTLTIADVVN